MNFFEKLKLAFQAFVKAFQQPEKGVLFLGDTSQEQEAIDQSHLRLLALLQQSGRFIDFLKEDISSFSDAQVGAAVRKIHEDCSKCLEELVTIRPVMEESEGMALTISPGFDPATIKIVGNVKGEPPFKGTLVHKGWKAHKRSLPKKTGEQLSDVIFPAEVEVK